jgi:hypothetical protein
VRVGVRTDSRGAQVPWESTSLESAFMFHAAAKPAPVKVAAAQPSAAKPSAPRAAPAALGASPSFAVGDNWTYRVVNRIDNSERRMTVRVKEIRGNDVIYDSGAVSDAAGNYKHTVSANGRTDDFSPSLFAYAFPLMVGANWNLDVEQRTGERVFDLKVSGRVVGEEELATPAGTMRALRVEREVRWKRRNGKDAGVNKWTLWYSAAVKRFVVADQTNITLDGKTLADERYELASYNVK